MKATKTEGFTIGGVDVFPIQPDIVDQAGGQLKPPNFFAPPFTEPAFVKETKSDRLVPTAPAFGKALGQARDLNIAGLHFPSAQYNPKTDSLKVFTQVDVQVNFVGGTKTFSDAIGSPWETAQNRIAGGLLNANVIRKIERPIIYQPCGEELLVITNPSTVSSANTYAAARRAAGFLTRVFQTGTAAVGTTAVSIQAFIRSHVNSAFCIRPSYVTIIGDDELVPRSRPGPARSRPTTRTRPRTTPTSCPTSPSAGSSATISRRSTRSSRRSSTTRRRRRPGRC